MLNIDEVRGIAGRVINIQHYCYHDGPGVRTTVFVKGCSLHCKWCGNPESISPNREFSFDRKECVGFKHCGKCAKAPFPEGMFTAPENETSPPVISWEKAKEWNPVCNSLCPTGALSTYGEDTTVGAVIDEVDQDYSFYVGSGGGITVSGGEPLLQPDFTSGLLELAHAHGYTTAIETAFNVPWANADKVLPHVDY
ncbi:MAG: glycyl-radical enzyme activating protein, partial [Acetatifactor sp.]|nr:glycyl-radical enzyme activating protein [Acetatifactor sp.]